MIVCLVKESDDLLTILAYDVGRATQWALLPRICIIVNNLRMCTLIPAAFSTLSSVYMTMGCSGGLVFISRIFAIFLFLFHQVLNSGYIYNNFIGSYAFILTWEQ